MPSWKPLHLGILVTNQKNDSIESIFKTREPRGADIKVQQLLMSVGEKWSNFFRGGGGAKNQGKGFLEIEMLLKIIVSKDETWKLTEKNTKNQWVLFWLMVGSDFRAFWGHKSLYQISRLTDENQHVWVSAIKSPHTPKKNTRSDLEVLSQESRKTQVVFQQPTHSAELAGRDQLPEYTVRYCKYTRHILCIKRTHLSASLIKSENGGWKVWYLSKSDSWVQQASYILLKIMLNYSKRSWLRSVWPLTHWLWSSTPIIPSSNQEIPNS